MRASGASSLLLRSPCLLLPLVLLLVALPSVRGSLPSSDWHAWRGTVLDLNDANFEENLEGREVVVEFFAPWCSACREFKPIYEQWAADLHRSPTALRHVAVARVDCTLNPEIARAQLIHAFPTLKLYRDGVPQGEFAGERSAAELTKWLQQKSRMDSLGASSDEQREGSGAGKSRDSRAPTQHSSASAAKAKKANAATGVPLASAAASLLSDWHLTEWTDVQHLRTLLRSLMDAPLMLFQSYPYMVLSVTFVLGLFQGLFCGILCAVRDKR